MDRLKEHEQYKYAPIESLLEHMISYVYTCEAQFLRTSKISEIFQFNVSRIFFEMNNLYIIWLYAFQFITCKIGSFRIWCYFCSIELAID